MKIVCDSCGAKYSIADEKVAGKIFKIRCKKCSSVLEVRGDQTGAHPFADSAQSSDGSNEATWYIVVDGEQKGPLPPIELSQLFAKGSVGLDSYVWKEGFGDWKVASWAVEQLNHKPEEPFFLAVGFVRPHVPYTAPKEYFDMYNLEEIRIPEVPEDEMADIPLMGKSIAFGTIKTGDHYAVVNLSDSYWKELVCAYLSCTSFVDDQVGKVIKALEDSKYADNTIVVLWSDHGQHLGEKKHWRKQALWEESTRVPLYFKAPGQKTGGLECDRAVWCLYGAW